MDALVDIIKSTKKASFELALLDNSIRNLVLESLASQLRVSLDAILKENAKDLASMQQQDPKYDRLQLSKESILSIANDIETLISLDSPLGKRSDQRIMENGLKIEKISIPLGVIAVIYESRPNVTIDVFSLAFKTGNACVLKGGKEAYNSNKILLRLIHKVLQEHKINSNVVCLLPPDRNATYCLLQATGLVDVCIPRGSQSLINFARENAKIPIIETGAGVVHTYFDISADLEKGKKIIHNAKTRRVSVCNALDTLIIHQARISDLPKLVEDLIENNVEIFADKESYEAIKTYYPERLLFSAKDGHFGIEFLAYKLSIKTVSSVQEAVGHILQYSSGHSEAIIAENQETISYFLTRVDVAAIYVNASTAFTDGGQFGMGTEIGISTQKLHARGPMGLESLTSYKWVILGDGHIRP